MKHAFLIIAHTDYYVLKTLISVLDHAGCDIYILFDKKSPVCEDLKTNHSQLYILKRRMDIRWGHTSQIKAEMSLFEAALDNGPYLYYHLLSGVDLPIKPMEQILSFFEKNQGKEFVGFVPDGTWEETKVTKFHFFIKYYRMGGQMGKQVARLRYHTEKFVNRYIKRSEYQFKKGNNWVSITDGFCRFLIGKKRWILRRFRYTFCADEIFLQTVLWNSPFKEQIYSLGDEFVASQREIVWEQGGSHPHIWGSSSNDISRLRESTRMFARKFSSEYPQLIQTVASWQARK